MTLEDAERELAAAAKELLQSADRAGRLDVALLALATEDLIHQDEGFERDRPGNASTALLIRGRLKAHLREADDRYAIHDIPAGRLERYMDEACQALFRYARFLAPTEAMYRLALMEAATIPDNAALPWLGASLG